MRAYGAVTQDQAMTKCRTEVPVCHGLREWHISLMPQASLYVQILELAHSYDEVVGLQALEKEEDQEKQNSSRSVSKTSPRNA